MMKIFHATNKEIFIVKDPPRVLRVGDEETDVPLPEVK